MSVSDDVDALLLAIFEREQERQGKREPQCYFESADITAALGWTPERFNRAVELLEKRGLVEVDESGGSTPFVTHGLFLTAEGWLACEKLGGRRQPAQPAATMPASSMARDPAEQHALDVVADYLEGTAFWIDGRTLRSKMKGSVEENKRIIDKLVPCLLVHDGEYPADRYRLTLEGAFGSRQGHVVRQYLGDVLDALKKKAKRSPTFTEFTVDDINAGDSDIAEAFDERAYEWLHRVMRIAGIVKESSPDGGPWGVPADIEEVLECKDVEELRALRRPARTVVTSSSSRRNASPFTPHQQRVVDAVTENWFTQPAWIKGRVLRALLREVAPDERDTQIQSLVPRYLQRSHQVQEDVYGPTLEGALQSFKGKVLRLYLGAVLAIFRKKYAVDPGFDDYAWREIVEQADESGVHLDDSDRQMIERVIVLARLGQRGITKDGAPTWSVPTDIELLAKLPDLDALLQTRIAATEPERTAPQQAASDDRESAAMTADPKKVFIIHGRNIAAKNAVEHFVRALGLEPLEFDEVSASLGGSAFVGDVVRAGLERAQGIIALFTPDEFSTLRPDHRGTRDKAEDVQRWQARPNVVFEAGMAYGMDPKRTVLVTIGGEVSLFSDVGGVHVVRLTNTSGRSTLRQKLIGMGCAVNERADAWTDPARSGDFESCIAGLSEVSPSDPFAEPAVVSEPDDEGFDGLGEEAARILKWLCAEYIKAGFPPHKTWNFSPSNDEQLAIFRELRAHDWIETMGAGEKKWRLTDMGQMLARRRK